MSAKSPAQIQAKLKSLRLPADDLLEQYVVVLLANQRTPADIGAELAPLLADAVAALRSPTAADGAHGDGASVAARVAEFARWLSSSSDADEGATAVVQAVVQEAVVAAVQDAVADEELDIVMDATPAAAQHAPPRPKPKKSTLIAKKPNPVRNPSFHVTLDGGTICANQSARLIAIPD